MPLVTPPTRCDKAGPPCGRARPGRFTADQCPRCWINRNPREYLAATRPRTGPPTACRFFGPPTGEVVDCETCSGTVRLKVFSCGVHGTCTPRKPTTGRGCCDGCDEKLPPVPSGSMNPDAFPGPGGDRPPPPARQAPDRGDPS